MEEIVLQQLKKLIKNKEMSVAGFAKTISMPQTTVNNYFRFNRTPSLEVIQATLSTYTDISPDWLLLGKGEMYRADIHADMNINNTNIGHDSTIALGAQVQNNNDAQLIKLLQQQNATQAAQIATLTRLLESLALKKD